MKKGIAWLLAVVLLIGLLPLWAFAEDGEPEGDGTKQTPYQIADADDLMAFAQSVSEGQTDACAELINNIDLTGRDWTPIKAPSKQYYEGTFDGRGYTVTIDVTVDENWDSSNQVGLFDDMKNATVKNIRMAGKVTVTQDYYDVNLCYGTVAATMNRKNTIENCSSTVEFSIGAGSTGVGGIVGYVYGDGNEIIGCANHGSITGTFEDDMNGYGGIVGWTDAEITLKYCYNSAAIHASGDGVGYAGGLIGVGYGTPTIIGCYTSASKEHNNPTLNPNWAACTGSITSDYAAGDFFGTAGEIGRDLAHNMTYCETIEGENGLNLYDFYDDNGEYQIQRAWDLSDSVEQAIAYLNGSDGTHYVSSAEMGDGWPVLAWELEEPVAQDTEQGKALSAVKKAFDDEKAAALKALDEGKTIGGKKYVGMSTYTYRQNSTYTNPTTNDYYRYSDENWTLMESVYSAAKAELTARVFTEPEGWETMDPATITADGERQRTEANMTARAEEALLDMDAVLTIARQKTFDGTKLRTQQEFYGVYRKQFYALDTDRGLVSAVWHELTADALRELDIQSEKLDVTLQQGLAAMGEAKTERQLTAASEKWTQALLAVLQDYSVPDIDSGVQDKWDGTAKTQPSGSGTQDDPYQIGTAAQLAWFADKVNGTKSSSRACAVLAADIDLNRQDWTAIAVNKSYPYLGTFDGQGHIIHGLLSAPEEGSAVQGLFGYMGRNYSDPSVYGTVKNVKVAGRIRLTQGSGSGLIAASSAGEIYNCEVSAFLGTWKGIGNVGGIVGSVDGGSVENCRAYGLFLASNESGYSGSMIGSIGGIVGSIGSTEPKEGCLVRYCENNLTIRGYEPSYLGGRGDAVGGIAGLISNTAKIRECVNNAEVWAGSYVGGIVGKVAESADAQIAYVTNNGPVRSSSGFNLETRGAGGIVGFSGDKAALDLSCAYNAGEVLGETNRNQYNAAYDYSATAPATGGIIGNWRSGSVSHAQSSSSDNTLWGYAAALGTNSEDAAKVTQLTPTVCVSGGSWDKLTTTRTLLYKLIRIGYDRDDRYKVYGDQSALYNAAVMDGVRRIELAEDTAAALQEAEKALDAVPTQLQAAKLALKADMQAYADENIYDKDEQKQLHELLVQANAQVDEAKDLSAVSDLRITYLGSASTDGRLNEIVTYPVKAANSLYNEFIYEKTYSQADMATLICAHESWKLKLNTATSFEMVEQIYAEARKALKELTDGFTPGETAPDMDQAARDALALARTQVLEALSEREKSYTDKLTALVGDVNTLPAKWQQTIQNRLTSATDALHTAAAPDLSGVTAYDELQALQSRHLRKLDGICTQATTDLTELLASARNTGAWDGATKTQPEKGTGTKDDPYQIGTAPELAWFADKVNTGSISACAVLTADIELGYSEWTPIGIRTNYNSAFRGVFDGQGHTVSGLYITRPHNGYVGLFGNTLGNTEIRNVTVSGEITLKDVTQTVYVGGLTGQAYSGEYSGCVSRVKITGDGLSSQNSMNSGFGGVIGSLQGDGQLTDCRFEGSLSVTVTSTQYLGRGTGGNRGGVGGIVGYIYGGSLTRCVNSAAVTVNKASGVGGITGAASGSYSKDKVTRLYQCVNTGHISNDTGFAIGAGEYPAGGVAGILGVADTYGQIVVDSCYNTGTVSGGIIAGGILGGEAGSYSTKTTSNGSGNKELVVRNCYNAGTLDTGTAVDRMGALAGYPIAGQYRDALYVLQGSGRMTMGWKSSQGDRITTLGTLAADMFPDLTESIADLNGGYPIFSWQLLLSDSRESILAYLNEYYHTRVEEILSADQRTRIEALLQATADTVRTADQAQTIIDAYHAALAAMDPDKLLDAARGAAMELLDKAYESAKAAYPYIEAGLTESYRSCQVQIRQSSSYTRGQAVVDGFCAQVVDLLVADARGAAVKLLTQKAETIRSAYEVLTPAQQALMENYGKLSQIQALSDLYAKDLDLLRQWGREDAEAYEDLAQQLQTLNETAQETLGNCTNQEALAPVLDGYCADAAKLLLTDVDFTSGTTTLRQLEDAADRLERTRKALDGLSETQRKLFGEESIAALESAETLLAVYRKADQTLRDWSAEDKATYPKLAAALDRQLAESLAALDACTDKDGAARELNRYCAKIADLLIDQIGALSPEPTEESLAAVRQAVRQAQDYYDKLTQEQKQYVTGLDKLTAAAEYCATATVKKPDQAGGSQGGTGGSVNTPAASDADAVKTVTDLIRAIGQVTLERKDAIEKALEAYDALTDAQKTLVSKEDKTLLDNAVAAYKALLDAQNTAQGDTATDPGRNDDGQSSAAFDWTIVWTVLGILAAAAVIFGLSRWFLAAKRNREKK